MYRRHPNESLSKRCVFRSFPPFWPLLASKIEFSYGAVQTVNLLALRLQWFESTPTKASPRAILQVFKSFGGQLGIPSPVSACANGRTRSLQLELEFELGPSFDR